MCPPNASGWCRGAVPSVHRSAGRGTSFSGHSSSLADAGGSRAPVPRHRRQSHAHDVPADQCQAVAPQTAPMLRRRPRERQPLRSRRADTAITIRRPLRRKSPTTRIGRRMLDNPAPIVEHRLPPSPASRSSPPKERPERVGRNPQNVACNMSRRPAKPSPSPPRECLPSRPGRPFTARSTHSKGSARSNPRRSPLPMSSRATTAHLDASAASPYPRADAPVRALGCFLIACAPLIAGPVPTVTGGSQSPRRCGRSALDPLAGACFPGRLGQERSSNARNAMLLPPCCPSAGTPRFPRSGAASGISDSNTIIRNSLTPPHLRASTREFYNPLY